MNFTDFPLYLSLRNYGKDKQDLTDLQKTKIIKMIETASNEKQEIVYALIRAYFLDNVELETKKKKKNDDDIIHYGGKELKKGIKYNVDNLPSSLQHILFQFLSIV